MRESLREDGGCDATKDSGYRISQCATLKQHCLADIDKNGNLAELSAVAIFAPRQARRYEITDRRAVRRMVVSCSGIQQSINPSRNSSGLNDLSSSRVYGFSVSPPPSPSSPPSMM